MEEAVAKVIEARVEPRAVDERRGAVEEISERAAARAIRMAFKSGGFRYMLDRIIGGALIELAEQVKEVLIAHMPEILRAAEEVRRGGWEAVIQQALKKPDKCLTFAEIKRLYKRDLNSEMLRSRGFVQRGRGFGAMSARARINNSSNIFKQFIIICNLTTGYVFFRLNIGREIDLEAWRRRLGLFNRGARRLSLGFDSWAEFYDNSVWIYHKAYYTVFRNGDMDFGFDPDTDIFGRRIEILKRDYLEAPQGNFAQRLQSLADVLRSNGLDISLNNVVVEEAREGGSFSDELGEWRCRVDLERLEMLLEDEMDIEYNRGYLIIRPANPILFKSKDNRHIT